MIVTTILDIITYLFSIVTHLLPQVTKLPVVMGYDIDSALVSGMATLNFFMGAFWPLIYMFGGFLVLVVYYVTKMIARAILGHRAPGVN